MSGDSFPSQPLRFAVLVSHPIQHFAPWHREIAKRPDIVLKVFFFSDWGVSGILDPGFGVPVQWDVPLLEGYDHEFLPVRKKLATMDASRLDNPTVSLALQEFRPDVVKIFGYNYRTNWRVVRWARTAGIPVMLYSDSSARVAYSIVKGSSHSQDGRSIVHLKLKAGFRRILKRPVVRYFYRHVDAALCTGDNNRAYHRSYGMPEERLFRGALPIDRARLLSAVPDHASARSEIRRQHGIPDDAIVLLFVGKYVAWKRPIDLLASSDRLRSRGYPVWALLVGEGAERPALEAYIRDAGMSNATLTGFVNQAEIPRYYPAADVLIVPSSFDQHPLAVTEAASFGLPIVISDEVGCIGPNDTAQPGVNALTYPCGEIEELVNSIERVILDKDLAARLSSASLEISTSQDVTVVAAQLADAAHALRTLGKR